MDNFLSLMAESGETKDDVPLLQNDVGKEIREKFDNKRKNDEIAVTILRAMNEEAAVSVRTIVH